ncbi:MAG: NAD(P)-binding domain-containing protein [Alphaproteobacteria bacterium]|nr:NAD(P)-binding domain-containing protein [Alphaproteobacteria bacterium]MDE2110001.1 NAD(P)-binding domain-containing protein [Alphaproteobacteria bacterium]MDE2495142.1 NAD(P)-binding domain-containing protein [Alphaproteobacteria bacterium]
MKNSCDVAIIGAGPYGLSLAAHLRASGVNFRIFGKPMDTWRAHMPKGMYLKSEGFASNLSAPGKGSTLKAYCALRGIAYADRALPISLDTFVGYGDWFRARHAPNLEEVLVTSVEHHQDGFTVTLESGENFTARTVVAATGVSHFSYVPEELSALPPGAVSHSYDHSTVERFKGQDVAIVGAGSSAIDLAWELHQAGAKPHIVTRASQIEYNIAPSPDAHKISYQLRNPPSTIGQGWKSYFCTVAPLAVHFLPAHLRARALRSHMHAAGGWFMRDKVEGAIQRSLGAAVESAGLADGRPMLQLKTASGERKTLVCDHVIAATGYRVDTTRLRFLSDAIRKQISPDGRSPAVSSRFETAVPDLYAIGMTTMTSFGPLLRFMVGAEFVAPRLAHRLRRRFDGHGTRARSRGRGTTPLRLNPAAETPPSRHRFS